MRSRPHRSPPLEEPIREELLGPERLEERGRALAAEHRVARRRGGRGVLRRLDDNDRVLRAARDDVLAAIRRAETITPAAEWLADNFYLVEEQIREARAGLPRSYYRELPKLEAGPHRGLPRVYALAWEYVAHTDSRFDLAPLRRLLTAYQESEPLTLGELWAAPTALRLVLVENLRRLAAGIVARRRERLAADRIADRLLLAGGDAALEPAAELERAIPEAPPSTFVAQLLQRLTEEDPVARPALDWLRARLEEHHTTADEVVRAELHRQATTQVSVANVITSMRELSATHWPDFLEEIAVVEQLLRLDPDGVHAAQDFRTRDDLRHAVEELARRSRLGEADGEAEVASRALERARSGAGPARHVGFHLRGPGRPALERELGFHPGWREALARSIRGGGLPLYSGVALLLAAVPAAGAAWLARRAGLPWPLAGLLAGLALVVGSDAALALWNRLLSRLVPPRRLPKLELEEGIPAELRTLVAVPMMLSGEDEIEEQAELLEVHYLANPDGAVSFALLADFTDAPAESLPADARPGRGGARRDRPPQRAPRSVRGRQRPLPLPPSPAALEPRRGSVDGLGAQARQARGAQPLAARRTRHDFRTGDARPSKACASSSPSTPTPACRAARRCAWSGRSPIRSTGRASIPPTGASSRATASCSRASWPTLPAPGEGSPYQHLRRSDRGRSVHRRGLRRLSGSVRGGLVHRQGGLRRRRLRRRARRPRAAEHAALARPLRGLLRALRAG